MTQSLPERLRSVLAVVYLVYNEGYLASGGDAVDRDELRAEAVRLARMMTDLMPDEPEARGLLALLLLTESRAPARLGADRRWVRLAEQDRSRGTRSGRRGAADRAVVLDAQPTWDLPAASGDRRRSQRCGDPRRHRLGPDRGALRPSICIHARLPSSR